MEVALIICASVIFVLLILVASVIPRVSAVSRYELERRLSAGNESARDALRREVLLGDLLSVQRLAVSILLVAFSLVVVSAWGGIGLVFALIAVVFYGKIATVSMVHGLAMRFYDESEVTLLKFVEHYPLIAKLIHSVEPFEQPAPLSSREELEHLVKSSQGILSEQDKQRIINGVHFDQRTVEEIMTPRGVMATVKKNDLIGPLLLNDLHQTGHSRFPVIDGDIDHVVGMLYTRDLINLGDKQSHIAGTVMDPRVFYINDDQTLNHALAAFLKTHHHMFIVVNGYRETAGVVTLEDVIEALLGHKIIDEFDVHDDLRAVAARSAKSNNNPPHSTNV